MNRSPILRPSRDLSSLSVAATVAAFLSVGCGASDSDADSEAGGTAAGTGGATGGSSAGGAGTSGGADASGGEGAGGGSTDGTACDSDDRLGGFIVQYTESSTMVGGSVYDAVTPMLVWEETAREGDCAIQRRPTLFCDPQCITPQTCGRDGVCIASPEKQSVGTVSLSGLSAAVEIVPDEVTNNYYFLGSIPDPGLTPSSTIGLTAAGGYFPAFELSAPGIEALSVTTSALTVSGDAPVTVEWTPAADPVGRVRVILNLSSHGTDTIQLECDVADTGSVEIPASLLSELIALEVAGYPRLTVIRESADSTAVSTGCIDLLVQSTVVLEGDAVQIAGVTYCTSADDCPSGEACLDNLTCG